MAHRNKNISYDNVDDDEEENLTVGDLYSVNDIQRLMYTNTLVVRYKYALRDVGFREDTSVSYIRIFVYFLLNCIGAYGTFYVHIENSITKLRAFVALFFSILLMITLYEKILLKGALYRLYLNNLTVLLWTNVNWRLGTFELYYRTNCSDKKCYSIPLGDIFYEDRRYDSNHFKKEMNKLKQSIQSNS